MRYPIVVETTGAENHILQASVAVPVIWSVEELSKETVTVGAAVPTV